MPLSDERLSAKDVKILSDAAFTLETIAHLQGREQLLLPLADGLRSIILRNWREDEIPLPVGPRTTNLGTALTGSITNEDSIPSSEVRDGPKPKAPD